MTGLWMINTTGMSHLRSNQYKFFVNDVPIWLRWLSGSECPPNFTFLSSSVESTAWNKYGDGKSYKEKKGDDDDSCNSTRG